MKQNVRALWVGGALTLGVVVACGDSSSDDGGAKNPLGGQPDGGQLSCPSGLALTSLQAVPVSDDGSCLETERPEGIAVCLGADQLSWSSFHCYQRASDGQRFWLMLWDENGPPSGWSLCDSVEPGEHPPGPCFTAHCPEPDRLGGQGRIFSTCSEEQIREQYRCGGSDVWDEDCCLRPACTEAGECPAGMECRQESPRAIQYCGEAEGQCRCSGAAGGSPSLFCFPKQE